jgi:transposase
MHSHSQCWRLEFKETSYSKIISSTGCMTLQKDRSNTTWSDQQIKNVLFFIDNEQAQATLEELLNHFVTTGGFPPITLATLWRYLEDQLTTVKGAAIHNQKRNYEENTKIRADFAIWFLENSSCTFRSIDEFGFNLDTSPSGSISTTPSDDYQCRSKCRDKQVHIRLHLTTAWGFLLRTETGSMKAPELVTSLSNFATEVQSVNLQNITAIIDSSCIHMEKEINQFCVRAGWKFEFLQPYSSIPNPIGEMLSLIKSDIKSSCWSTSQTAITSCNIEFGRNWGACEETLAEALDNAMKNVMVVKVVVFYGHMVIFLPRILTGQDL